MTRRRGRRRRGRRRRRSADVGRRRPRPAPTHGEQTATTIQDPATKARAAVRAQEGEARLHDRPRAHRPADPRRRRGQGDVAPGEGQRQPQGARLGLPDRRDHDRRVVPAEHPVLDRARRRPDEARPQRLETLLAQVEAEGGAPETIVSARRDGDRRGDDRGGRGRGLTRRPGSGGSRQPRGERARSQERLDLSPAARCDRSPVARRVTSTPPAASERGETVRIQGMPSSSASVNFTPGDSSRSS